MHTQLSLEIKASHWMEDTALSYSLVTGETCYVYWKCIGLFQDGGHLMRLLVSTWQNLPPGIASLLGGSEHVNIPCTSTPCVWYIAI